MTNDADSVASITRASARQLAKSMPSITLEAERAILLSRTSELPKQYFDPISLGALLVSAATLAWTIYNDSKTRRSSRTELEKSVTESLPLPAGVDQAAYVRIVEVVASEAIVHGTGTILSEDSGGAQV